MSLFLVRKDSSPCRNSAFSNRISTNFTKRGKERYAFSEGKKVTKERCYFELEVLNRASDSFPTELLLISKENRLIKIAVLHLQRSSMEGEGNFLVCLFRFWEARNLKTGV